MLILYYLHLVQGSDELRQISQRSLYEYYDPK